MNMSDEGLARNPAVTARQLEQLHDAAWNWARSQLDDADGADEVMQQAYVLIISGKAVFNNRSTLKTWLFGVVRNVARQYRRRYWLQRVRHSQALREDWTVPNEQQTDDRRWIWSAIRELPRRQREVLELVAYRECTLEECGRILGIRIGSVRTHYHRAKKTLADRLGALDD